MVWLAEPATAAGCVAKASPTPGSTTARGTPQSRRSMAEARAEGEPERGGASAYSWYALGVLFLVYLVNFVDRQILSILANDIKADLGLTDAELGFLYGTAFAIFYALFGIPLGRLADNWSRTRLLASGLALWSLMTALSGFARSGAT